MVVYLVIAFVCLILIYIFVVRNKIVKLNNNVNEAFATMDVYLKKRWDLIPNIVETVKGYAKHEKNTLEEIVQLRNNIYDNMSDSEKLKTNVDVASKVNKLMALAESYPELKASENFLNLSQELSQIEKDIANSRKYFNGTVRDYNNKVEMFPSNVIARLFGYKSKEMFKAREEEKENVKVEL